MRLLYSFMWWLALPLVLGRLWWRGRREPGYRAHLGERLGFYGRKIDRRPTIMVHAISVGETRAAEPLIEALLAARPDARILLTHMTPTGREAGIALFGDRVERAWLPYDHGFATRRFIENYAPAIGIILETEIWPRLLEECARAAIPVVLANARLSERSARRYSRAPALTRWALANFAGIAAQTEADAARFASLGAAPPAITGNMKFDLAVPPAMTALGERFRARFGTARRIWVAGSTRDGEEALLLDAYAAMPIDPAVLLVIVPRHPQRFDDVGALAAARGLACERRSAQAQVGAQTRVVIGDSMGEMLAYYEAADVVIVGGSLLPFGSQNLIAACALGKPVIVGPSTFNFEEAAAGALAAGAALRVADADGAIRAARELTANESRRIAMGTNARDFVAAHRGAVDRLVDWIAPKVGAT